MTTLRMAELSSIEYLSVTCWIDNNLHFCEGGVIRCSLLYELYLESRSPHSKHQINSAIFGKSLQRPVYIALPCSHLCKINPILPVHFQVLQYDGVTLMLLRIVFPGLRTKRLGKRGNSRYHYVGITIRENSPFYSLYCSLLSEKNYRRENARRSGDAVGYMSLSQKNPTAMLLANEYYSYCQDILYMVRSKELLKVKDCIMSFWRSLQPEKIAVMSLTDVVQLFKIYDRQLFKEIENILLNDLLQEMPSQQTLSIKSFCKNVEDWMLNALAGFPLQFQTSKSEEITLFKKRLRRKTDLSIIAKTMATVLNSNSKVIVLQSVLCAVIREVFPDVTGKLFQAKSRNLEELRNNTELKCFKDLIPLLVPSTDIRVLLDCVYSNLQVFVIQPSKSKEDFRKVASDFQLRWNFLLTNISKSVILKYSKSFGSWHLFNLLLVDFVAHIFQSYIEEEGDESFQVIKQEKFPTPFCAITSPDISPGLFYGGATSSQHSTDSS